MSGLSSSTDRYEIVPRLESQHVDATLILLHGFENDNFVLGIGVHMGDNATAEKIGKNEFNAKIDSVNDYPGNDPIMFIFYKKISYPHINERQRRIFATSMFYVGLLLGQESVEYETYSNQLSLFRSNFILGLPDVQGVKECLTVEALNNEIQDLLTLDYTSIEGNPGTHFWQAEEDVVIRRREAVQRKVVKSLRL